MRERLKALLTMDGWREGLRLAMWVAGLSTGGVITLWGFSRHGAERAAVQGVEAAAAPVFASGAALVTSAGQFTHGKMLYNVLTGATLSPEQSSAIAQTLAKILDPRSLNAEDRYELVSSTAGDFSRLSIVRRMERFIVEAAPTGLRAQKEPVPVVKKAKIASGTLQDSLWLAMSNAGMEPAVIVSYADIFAWTVDFLTDPRPGDRFALAWEEHRTPDGRLVDVRITAAIYEGKATGRHTATYFDEGYFDDEGESLRRAFLHAPLNFRRISSGFTRRRFHPILRRWRAHHGTDYAAPTGTPVVSVGDGTVIFRGRQGGMGNLIKVRHNGTYTTYYGHLSRFAKNVGSGTRVKQGQVIGYVGATGLATGPHLHFQITKNGALVNFLSLKFPSMGKVPAARMAEFHRQREQGLAAIQNILPAPSPQASAK